MRGNILKGYFGIGIENGKMGINLGGLWRSAQNLGASFIFTIGKRYRREASDTGCASNSIPLFEHSSLEEFTKNIPDKCKIIGIECGIANSGNLINFCHPRQSIYLLGAEDIGLSKHAIDMCSYIVHIPSKHSLNVSSVGSILMYDRLLKSNTFSFKEK